MLSKGISQTAIDKIQPIFNLNGSFLEKIDILKNLLASSEIGLQGLDDLLFIYEKINSIKLQVADLELDVTLARGLNYYTGSIFEVAPPQEIQLGSIGGGGRYDNLTSIFGLNNISGVGISFGLDRIFLVMEELGLFPSEISQTLDVLFVNLGEEEALKSFELAQKLRKKGLKTEVYPESSKLKKQLNYADKRNVKNVIIIGQEEFLKSEFTLKNMQTGQQETHNFTEIENIF